ncbi:MAG TPA: outer membrane beta-barrel protein [Terriglobia bacterium]|nr:outer membrane beta-barrel protein [Terriglobia bacterium]
MVKCGLRGMLAALTLLLLCTAVPVWGQQTFPFHRWNFDIGAGATPTVGTTKDELSTGWNVQGGAGVNFNPYLGVTAQVLYTGLGVNNSVIRRFNVPGADAHIWGFTLNPEVRINPDGRVGLYFIGGGGYYRRVVNFTEPTLQTTLVFDPFFGIITPVTYQAKAIIGTITRVGWGGNVGEGITFRVGRGGAKLFVEARFHYISTQSEATKIVPITVGVRW